MFKLTIDPINVETLSATLRDRRSGAFVTFEGWVRDHNQGERVSALEYQVYEELTQKEGEKILDEAKEKFNLQNISCIHRHGLLKITDRAVWVGAIASHRDDAFRAARYVIDEVKYRLPIWKKEHYLDKKAQWVSCRDRRHHVDFDETDYYAKQSKILNQDALKKARVLVVGAGGLGCPALQALTMAGVGYLQIIDFDKIEISNIHRQPLYTPSLVGEKKAIVASKKLKELNPFIKISGLDVRLNSENAKSLIQNFDLVLDCTDNLESKLLLHDVCFQAKTPLITAGLYKNEGQIRTFLPDSPFGCLRCQFKETPDDSFIGNCNDVGVSGSSVAVLGALQGSEALVFLQNKINSTTGETFYLNVTDLSQMKIRNKRRAGCAFCEGKRAPEPFVFTIRNFEVSRDDLGSDFELVDLRDKDDSYLENYKNHDKKVLVYCHRGIRSRKLVMDYRLKGFSHFYSLKGGACSL